MDETRRIYPDQEGLTLCESAHDALSLEDLDGYGFAFESRRFNIRLSNTEPVVRHNVESRGDVELMRNKTEEVPGVLDSA